MSLAMQPTAGTTQLMQRLGLKFLATPFGGAVYANVEKSGNSLRLKSLLPPNTMFQFTLHDVSGGFYPITEWPLGYKPGQLMVFSNQHNNVQGGKPLLVKNATTKSFGADDLFEKVQGSYTFTKAFATDATVAITLQNSGQQFVQEALRYKGKVSTSFNLAPADGGFAKLSLNGAVEKTLYVLPLTTPANTLGIVEIVYKTNLPASHQFLTPTGIVNSKTYAIPFLAAMAMWRYKVKRQFNDAITSVSVEKDNPDAIAFSTEAGSEVGSFISTSNNALPLRQQPITGIALKNQAQKIIIPHLPNPNLQQIVAHADGTRYAEMLITI